MLTDWLDSLQHAIADMLGPHGPAAPATVTSYAPGDFSVHLFLQLAVILVACRLVGWLGRRLLGQPQVVGEMVAGVVLGPSLLGLALPGLEAAIFPKETRSVLYAGAQLGVGLYMFLVGTRLRLDHVRGKARSAALVSLAGIAAPFAIAVPLTPVLLGLPGLFAPGIGTGAATLFLGACIALTAFPMLARIINERGLADSALGTLSLTAGAFDDACSWCVLAVVLAIFGGGAGVAILAIAGALAWTLVVVLAAPRILAPLARSVERDGDLGIATLSWVMVAFCLSAFLMDAVGHARDLRRVHRRRRDAARAVERGARAHDRAAHGRAAPADVLHLFGAQHPAGRGQLAAAARWSPIGIIAASIIAKGGACYLAARLCRRGQPHGARHRRADEFTRADGTHHRQYRAAERDYRPAAVLDPGANGDRDDDDGGAAIRAVLRPPCARRRGG